MVPCYFADVLFTGGDHILPLTCSGRASQDPSSTSVSPSLKALSVETTTATKGPEHEVIPSFILLYLISDWKQVRSAWKSLYLSWNEMPDQSRGPGHRGYSLLI